MTTGFQLSYGLLYLFATRHLGQDVATETSEYHAFPVVYFFGIYHQKKNIIMAITWVEDTARIANMNVKNPKKNAKFFFGTLRFFQV